MRPRKRVPESELDVTVFFNLMVILIPFLLINAVFAQVTALQLNLPGEAVEGASAEETKKPFVLEVLIYQDRYEVVDRQSGTTLSVLENTEDGEHDRAALRNVLAQLKAAAPEINDITILSEDDTSYELLIYTMDSVRYRLETVNNTAIRRNLFPDIAIGSAPPDARNAAEGQ